ncbi:MAG: TonB family protein [Azoarcus sp.]|nr:TonB family protein [Azoarcus sp.]
MPSLPRADEAPLWVCGFLLLLVLAAHLAGLVALSNMNGSQTDVQPPAILRVGWIAAPEAVSDAAPAPPSPSVMRETPVRQPAPTRASTTSGRQTPSKPAVPPTRRQTVAAPRQSSEPEPESTAVSAIPAESGLPATAPTRADIATAVEAMVSEKAGRGGQATGGAADGGADIIPPDFRANYLSNPKPEYPPLSHRLREQGIVKLRVHVTAQGRADAVTLHNSSGYGRLDKAASDVVRSWRFSPARRAGAFVAAWVVVPIKFELRD